MKKIITTFIAIILAIFATTSVMAQGASATTTASAKIYTVLTLEETSPLSFGSMTKPTTAATVILTPSGVRTIGTGTIVLMAQAPVSSNAAYNVTGSNNDTYLITLPTVPVIITNTAVPTATMNVTNFTALSFNVPSATIGTLSATGTDSFKVGAQLNLLAGQEAGLYQGTYNVTVNYN